MTQASSSPILSPSSPATMRIGWLVGVDDSSRPIVDYEGNPYGPLIARTVVKQMAPLDGETTVAVLLTFEDQDGAAPVIIGQVRETMVVGDPFVEFQSNIETEPVACVDGRRVLLVAKEEIELSCGKSSIRLRKDGKVVIRGVHLVSRAAQSNRIHGGSVAIN